MSRKCEILVESGKKYLTHAATITWKCEKKLCRLSGKGLPSPLPTMRKKNQFHKLM